MKSFLYLLCILSLSIFIFGCSASAEPNLQTGELNFDQVTDKTKETCTDSNVKESSNTPSNNNWEVFKSYVLDNSDISKDYFDKHFSFLSSEYNVNIRSRFLDIKTKDYPVIVEDVEKIKYQIVLTNNKNEPVPVNDYSGYVYIKDGKVLTLDETKINLPKSELYLNVNKNDAISSALNNLYCSNSDFFDISDARRNIELVYTKNTLVWSWESNGNFCLIDAQIPGQIEVIII